MHQIYNPDDGAALQQDDCSTVTLDVTDEDGTATITASSLTIANVIFDAFQTDALWSADTTGYNFKYVVPNTALPSGGKWYEAVVKIVTTGGNTAKGRTDIFSRAINTS